MHSVVVGGTSGTGKVVARHFAEAGHRVSVVGRGTPTAQESDGVRHWACDITGPQRDTTVDAIVEWGGPVDNLVFLQRYRGAGDRWSGEIETVISATRAIVDRLSDHFVRQPGASIVVVSSIAGQLIAEEQDVSYHVAKAAVQQLVRYYAVLLGRQGVRVNTVAPAGVLKDENRDFYASSVEARALQATAIPLGRIATAEDVAHVVGFLCSEKASYVTGQIITMDGGASLQAPESLARRLVRDDRHGSSQS